MAQIRTTITGCLCLLALALPAHAAAQGTSVPPGQSEADQYFETVPDGKGNKSLDGGKDPKDVLTDEQLAELESLGEDGLAAAQLAASTAPGDSPGAGAGGAGAQSGPGPDGAGTSGSEQPDGAAAAAVAPTRDGLGGLLWVVLIAVAVGTGIYALARRSRAGS